MDLDLHITESAHVDPAPVEFVSVAETSVVDHIDVAPAPEAPQALATVSEPESAPIAPESSAAPALPYVVAHVIAALPSTPIFVPMYWDSATFTPNVENAQRFDTEAKAAATASLIDKPTLIRIHAFSI